MFGRRKKNEAAPESAVEPVEAGSEVDRDVDEDAALDTPVGAVDGGPYDVSELDEDEAELASGRLDLGSVLLPIPDGAQLQVEMSQEGAPQAVHLVTQFGRITVSAYTAPKSPGQWREVASELADSLRGDNAEVSVESGPWGREVLGVTPNADLRFIGVDGARWMVRCVVAGPTGNVAAGSPLVEIARAVLRGTIVKRGTEPHPVRTPLPIVLPQVLVEQLMAAHQQQLAQQQAAAQQAAQQQDAPQGAQQQTQPQPPSSNGSEPPRRGESGSAMQQLGL
ncbi:DUF3710 domain-containing protein [Rhodococcus sp. SGAir0479]|uniref:DUF3710 domain-containing protein n=1 Tax=Rhodococcus sp. SGAir0479 TaxID=2567884 RepID=UPI0010CCFD18|nr:DUF3710 domain-containing protein [Rhodococcus sp. SGAir0479]QCQ90831.1 DUF3710 domain-containing protein [Rhodococcus sp. SGAir0479]